jgi:hypothetical protein
MRASEVRLLSGEKANRVGRAAAIAAEKKSFDLCDDSEGLGVGQILSDPQYLKFFGYGPAAEKKKKESPEEPVKRDAQPESEPAEPVKPLTAIETVAPTTNGISSDAPSADPAVSEAFKPISNVIVPVVQASTEVEAA